MTSEAAVEELRSTLPRVRKLALRPHQKVELLAGYLIPHFLYPLAMGPVGTTRLKELDRDVRMAVKDYLHLSASTADGLIYTAKRDGGLGFPRLEPLVTATTLRAGWKFLNSKDPVMATLGPSSKVENRMKTLAHAAHLGWPINNLAEITKYRARFKAAEQKAWESLPSQGKGVAAYRNYRVGNNWLYRPQLLKPCRYISALRLRANIAGNKVSIYRTTKTGDVLCRQCGVQPETMGHILGQCTSTKTCRIKRHNEIRDLIETRVAARAGVCKEMRLQDPQGRRLQPDLVLVADVTVCHEDGDLLTRGKLGKLSKYASLKPTLMEKFNAGNFAVIPIVVGTRGAMPKETIDALKTLGIEDKSTLTTISMIALRSLIEMYHAFLDYDRFEKLNRDVPRIPRLR